MAQAMNGIDTILLDIGKCSLQLAIVKQPGNLSLTYQRNRRNNLSYHFRERYFSKHSSSDTGQQKVAFDTWFYAMSYCDAQAIRLRTDQRQFPYALEALPSVLQEKWNEADFQQYRDAFPEEHRTSPETLQAHVQDLTRRDVKIAYLKNLQGYLWATGYRTHVYATPFFPDVLPFLKHIATPKSPSIQVAIYSSGSVAAQKLLFEHVKTDTDSHPSATDITTPSQDLTGLVAAWFDTTNAGPKTESQSYKKILKDLGSYNDKESSKVLFFSDSVKEVRAAIEAGMEAVVVVREGNAPLTSGDLEGLRVIRSFEEVN